MQDRYVGDVGDFGKYFLLKKLMSPDLQLGIVWCLNESKEENKDGSFRDYLGPKHAQRFRRLDPQLFDQMKKINCAGDLRVSAIREQGIFQAKTIFFEYPINCQDRDGDCLERLMYRDRWCRKALEQTEATDVVFFDPDNGIASEKILRSHRRSRKYVFKEDIEGFPIWKQSVIVYHHLGRQGKHVEQISEKFCQLEGIKSDVKVWAITFHAWQTRAFFILASPKHKTRLLDRTLELVEQAQPSARKNGTKFFEYHPSRS